MLVGFTDPVFRKKFDEKYGGAPEEKVVQASQEWVGDVFSGAAHTWDQIALLKKHWGEPIVLKGIQVSKSLLWSSFSATDLNSTPKMPNWLWSMDVMELLLATTEVRISSNYS